MKTPCSRRVLSGVHSLLISIIFLNCAVKHQLAEPCMEKGKMYRSLGSLKANFVDVDSTYLPRIIKVSEALHDKWIRLSAESGDPEVRVIDWSTHNNGELSYLFATAHRHIVYPTFPKKALVKLPCTVEISFETGFTKIHGHINLELKLRNDKFKQVYGYWEWNERSNKIEFTEEGANAPTIYWDLN